ncbi:MAG: hypothetical protein JXA50_09820 [Deltaproteobacteria bacterium]|nr:hypothetical protein [Deltaproteobacteria bacterium]
MLHTEVFEGKAVKTEALKITAPVSFRERGFLNAIHHDSSSPKNPVLARKIDNPPSPPFRKGGAGGI